MELQFIIFQIFHKGYAKTLRGISAMENGFIAGIFYKMAIEVKGVFALSRLWTTKLIASIHLIYLSIRWMRIVIGLRSIS